MKRILAVLMVLSLVGLFVASPAWAASFNKFEDCAEKILTGTHNFTAAGDEFDIYLSDATPSASADAVKTDLAEITIENGYTGAEDTTNDMTETSGTATVTGVDVVITASGGTVGPFRYVVYFNQTSASDNLCGWWDYGSEVTLQDGETFTWDVGASVLTLQ